MESSRLFIYLIIVFTRLISTAEAQIPVARLQIVNTSTSFTKYNGFEDFTLILPCNTYYFQMAAQYFDNSQWKDLTVLTSDVTSNQPNFSLSNSSSFYLNATSSNTSPSDDFEIKCYKTVNGVKQYNPVFTFTIHVKTAPQFGFSPNNPGLGNGQTATYSVVSTNIYSNYQTSVVWNTSYGLLVNGGSSFNSGTGTSASLSAPNYGGKLSVTMSNTCGSTTIIGNVGTPYIKQKYVNGNPSGSYYTISSSSATLSIDTENSGTSCSWTQNGGNGTYSANGFTCQVAPVTFIRMIVQPSNQNGQGQSDLFYITKQSYRGYSMAYPNPTNDQINIDFDDAEYTDFMLKEVSLVNKNSEVVRSIDISSTKSKKYFQHSKSVKLDTKGLMKGVYYLRIVMGDQVNTDQIVVN